MHWVEVSRAVAARDATALRGHAPDDGRRTPSTTTRPRRRCAPGRRATTSIDAVSQGFSERGYHLGHVTGHSIGMTMIEFPKVGEGVDVELRAGMVLSMHPHAIAPNGEDCLYMQDTWLVTRDGGRPARRPADGDLRQERFPDRLLAAWLESCCELALDRAARPRGRRWSWPPNGRGVQGALGADARRRRERARRKAKLRVVEHRGRGLRRERPARPRQPAHDRGARDRPRRR